MSQLPTCDDPCSGEITVTPNFGAAPVTYSWSHDATETGPVGSGVCEQVVLVSATDDNGCTDQDIITVEIPPVEVLAFGTDPSCFGFADGEASAVATGGLGGGFTFDWTDGNGNPVGTGADLSGLPAGNYTVTTTDSGGCGMSTTVALSDPPPVAVDMGATPVSCAGDSDGSAFALFPGATFYDWTGSGGFATSGADLDSISGLSPGSYAVLTADGIGANGYGGEPTRRREPFLSAPSCPACRRNRKLCRRGERLLRWSGPSRRGRGEWRIPDGQSAGTFITPDDMQDARRLRRDVGGPGCGAGARHSPCSVRQAPGPTGSIVATVIGGLGPYSATWSTWPPWR